MAEHEEELNSLLMKVKRGEWKGWLKLSIQKMKIMALGPITSWQIDGAKTGNSDRLLFSWAPKSLWAVTATMKLKDPCSLEEKLWQIYKSVLNNRGITLPIKSPYSQNYGFSSSHIQMWELDHKEGWGLKNWCFWTVVLEKTFESLSGSKEIKSVNPKGNQPWIFIWRTDAEVEAPTLWPPDVKSWVVEKYPDAGKDWGWEEKARMRWVGWPHRFNGHEFEKTRR